MSKLGISPGFPPISEDGPLAEAYHQRYYGDDDYEEAFEECFSVEWTIRLIEAVFGKTPPYTLLDSGSANGLTLAEFARAGVDAWGIENSPYMHARTPKEWLHRNVLGDVRNLPFPDNHFDFVYDTSLCYVPAEGLDQAIKELHRVTRVGLFFAGVAADMTHEVIVDYHLFNGVRSLMTLPQWRERLERNGFRRTATDKKTQEGIWQVESEIGLDEDYWYNSPESMSHCFYRK